MAKVTAFTAALFAAFQAAAITATKEYVDRRDAETYAAATNAIATSVDFSTNNTELVATIEAKAPTPDLSPFLRKDLGQVGWQEFGGYLSGMGFHVTHEVSNFNG